MLKKEGKFLITFFLLICFSSVFATNLGSERDINVFIDEPEFGYTKEVEANEVFYLKLRIIDVNSTPLRNYHIDFKVEDDRGALISDYSKIESDGKIYRIISDDNGFINFSFPINTCNAISQEFCYRIDETYTFRIIQKDLDRRENFLVIPQTLEHNWLGQSFRWAILNMDYLFIVVILLIISITLIGTGVWAWRSRK